jgi:SAM-dependent methyltransferase
MTTAHPNSFESNPLGPNPLGPNPLGPNPLGPNSFGANTFEANTFEADAHELAADERIAELESQVRALTKRLASLETDVRRMQSKVDGSGPRFAALYAGFADRFRGSTADVTAKLAAYLPDVRRLVRGGDRSAQVVDLGSGRGEWLTLLRAHGVPAHGVDANEAFVAAGRSHGLDMVHGDAVAHVQNLPPESVALVTAFHLIEHVDVDTLLALLSAAHRALRAGGGILLETPNPNNLRMAACDFYNDPTHRSPLPPDLTEYLVTACGFVDVEVRPMNAALCPFEPHGEMERLVADALYGPQDYAVLGYKSSG